jgi:hypothetical protein
MLQCPWSSLSLNELILKFLGNRECAKIAKKNVVKPSASRL